MCIVYMHRRKRLDQDQDQIRRDIERDWNTLWPGKRARTWRPSLGGTTTAGTPGTQTITIRGDKMVNEAARRLCRPTGCGLAGLRHGPVTAEIAGSSPVIPIDRQ